MAEAKTFNFKVRAKPTGSVAFRVLEAKFGDGYTQRGSDGIHSLERAYQVSIMSGKTCGSAQYNEALAAKAFLDATYGYISFLWTPPGEVTAFRFVAKSYNISREGMDVFTITTTFTQDYKP